MSIIGGIIVLFLAFPALNVLFGDGHDRCGVWGHNEGCDCEEWS